FHLIHLCFHSFPTRRSSDLNFITFINKILVFSSFVNTASGFPKPLTLEEEKEYFKRFKEGDKEAKDILISHNLRLVAHIVKKYSDRKSTRLNSSHVSISYAV